MRYQLRFGLPEKSDALLIQGHLSPYLYRALSGIRCNSLDLNDRTIWVHPKFLFHLIKYSLTTSRLAAMVLANISCREVAVVLAMDSFDLSQHTQGGASLFEEITAVNHKVKAFLVQHGQELRRLPSDRPNKRVVLLCWGDWVADNFPRFGRREIEYKSVGALIDGLYRESRPAEIEKDVDIAYVSTIKGPDWWGNDIGERRAGYEKLTVYLRDFASRHTCKLHIGLTIDRDQNDGDEELQERSWFLQRLGNQIEFTSPSLVFGDTDSSSGPPRIASHVKERFGTYFLSDRARITLGMSSSVLWESFGRGNKILAVNLTDNEAYDFPIPGRWSLRQPSYREFETQLLDLLEMSQEEWMKQTERARHYLMHYDHLCPPHCLISREVRRAIGNWPI